MNNPKNKADIVIPAAALAEAGFLSQGKAAMQITENLIILTKPHMSAQEMEKAAGMYLSLASSLREECFDKTGEYLDCGGGETEECDDCIHALEGECDGAVAIPPCMLLDAGLSPDALLQYMARDGSIVITAVDEDGGDGNDVV